MWCLRGLQSISRVPKIPGLLLLLAGGILQTRSSGARLGSVWWWYTRQVEPSQAVVPAEGVLFAE